MNPRLEQLYAYPFERLRALHHGLSTPEGLKPINLGIGEPQHPTPEVIKQSLAENLHLLGKYPPTGGTPELRSAISDWLQQRYGVAADPATEILPVAGSREALFGFAQAVLDPADPGATLLPNPFYQIYEGAAIMAGSEPVYVPTPAPSFLTDWSRVSAETWAKTKLIYVCSPGNPAGAVMGLEDWKEVFALADRVGAVIAADECYSEIYLGEAPMGALQAAQLLGRGNERLVVFNSLSKRSSAPGLRSGFVAGDPAVISKFLRYRTYHGAAPSLLTQKASEAAWSDEHHVVENLDKYREKFKLAARIRPGLNLPAGGFFLWLPVENDEDFSRQAYTQAGLTLLPGRYLARKVDGENPGEGYVRIALVADVAECEEALLRLSQLLP